MAPTPSLSAKWSNIHWAAFAIALARTTCGPHTSSHLIPWSAARKKLVHVKSRFVGGCGQRRLCGASRNNAATPICGGILRTRLLALKSLNGAIFGGLHGVIAPLLEHIHLSTHSISPL